MNFHRFCIIAGAVCFGLAAFGVVVPVVALPMLGMCFFVLAFY